MVLGDSDQCIGGLFVSRKSSTIVQGTAWTNPNKLQQSPKIVVSNPDCPYHLNLEPVCQGWSQLGFCPGASTRSLTASQFRLPMTSSAGGAMKGLHDLGSAAFCPCIYDAHCCDNMLHTLWFLFGLLFAVTLFVSILHVYVSLVPVAVRHTYGKHYCINDHWWSCEVPIPRTETYVDPKSGVAEATHNKNTTTNNHRRGSSRKLQTSNSKTSTRSRKGARRCLACWMPF